ncbi:MAG: hypothetical protein ACRDQZ_18695, partial [Mycobacteriales bacterium]
YGFSVLMTKKWAYQTNDQTVNWTYALPHGRILPDQRGCLMGNLTLSCVLRADSSEHILR